MSRKKIKISSRNQNKQTTTYVPVYSKKDYKNDEKQFDKSMKDGNVNWGSFKRLMLHDICTNTNIIDTGCIGNVKIEDAMIALKNPKHDWKILMAVSDELMRISPHYYRMNNLYSNMALFCWWIDLYDVKENINNPTMDCSVL